MGANWSGFGNLLTFRWIVHNTKLDDDFDEKPRFSAFCDANNGNGDDRFVHVPR